MLKKYKNLPLILCTVLLIISICYNFYLAGKYKELKNGYSPIGTYQNRFIDNTKFYQVLVIYEEDGLKCEVYNQFEAIQQSNLEKINSDIYTFKLGDNSVYFIKIVKNGSLIFSDTETYEYKKVSNTRAYSNVK